MAISPRDQEILGINQAMLESEPCDSLGSAVVEFHQ